VIDLKNICIVDGGRIEEEVRGDKLIRTCMRCGTEERLDYVEPDSLEINKIAELERSLTEEMDEGALDSDQQMYAAEDAKVLAAEDARERRSPVDRSMADPPFGVQRQRRVPVSTDWREVAKARLAALIEQLTTAEEAAHEAQEIYVALSACGIRLDPLPECVKALVNDSSNS
jgi:hypothetical protein